MKNKLTLFFGPHLPAIAAQTPAHEFYLWIFESLFALRTQDDYVRPTDDYGHDFIVSQIRSSTNENVNRKSHWKSFTSFVHRPFVAWQIFQLFLRRSGENSNFHFASRFYMRGTAALEYCVTDSGAPCAQNREICLCWRCELPPATDTGSLETACVCAATVVVHSSSIRF